MRLYLCLLYFAIGSCSLDSQKGGGQIDSSKVVAIDETAKQQEEGEDVDFRREFISLYKRPVHIDTFFVDSGKKYEIIFRHFSTMDYGLVVPARYNFDTGKDFITHNFISELTVLSGNDTVFKKHITKATFHSFLDTLDTPLDKYATLLYPSLKITNHNIQIGYSISIPVTDVGMAAYIKFDKKGNYVIGH